MEDYYPLVIFIKTGISLCSQELLAELSLSFRLAKMMLNVCPFRNKRRVPVREGSLPALPAHQDFVAAAAQMEGYPSTAVALQKMNPVM